MLRSVCQSLRLRCPHRVHLESVVHRTMTQRDCEMVSSFFSRAHLATIHYPPTAAHFSCFLCHIFYFLSLSFCQHVDAPSCSFFSKLFFAMLAYTQTNFTQFSLQEHSFTVQWRLTFPLVVDREFFNIRAPTFISFTFFHLYTTRSFFYFIFLFSFFLEKAVIQLHTHHYF